MKGIASFLAATVLVFACASGMLAQSASDPYAGSWKLNVAKSQYKGTAAPQSSTIKIETQGTGEKVSVEGTAADGSHVAYSFTSALDGKAVPVSGSGVPNGAEDAAGSA